MSSGFLVFAFMRLTFSFSCHRNSVESVMSLIDFSVREECIEELFDNKLVFAIASSFVCEQFLFLK